MGEKQLETTETKEGGCKNLSCIELLQLIVDEQATHEQEVYFKDHIGECVSCFNNYEVDKGVKQLIREKIDKLEVPIGLQDAILSKIKESA